MKSKCLRCDYYKKELETIHNQLLDGIVDCQKKRMGTMITIKEYIERVLK